MKTIETERLILRGWQLDDLDDLYEYAKNPNVGPMAGWEPHSSKEISLGILTSFIEKDEVWAITLKENGKVIGSIGLHPEENKGKYYAKSIGFVLSEDYWGKGYMTEAVKRITKYAFDEMNLDMITVFHFPHNLRSKNVIVKCGFEYETTLEQTQKIYDGQVFDSVCYSMLKSDYYKDNKVNVEIKRLTPDLAEEYAHFFDTTPHNDEGNGIKCYCVTWRNDDSYVGDDHWYPTPEERRAKAIQFVKAGKLQGYLAYHGEKIVGWCNATADCRIGVNYLRSYWPIEETGEGIKVKSVFCFVIAPEMQRKGVATQLLECICKDAADDGFDFVEAYVNEVYSSPDFRGPLTMYEKCGFIKCAEKEGKVVVRKALK